MRSDAHLDPDPQQSPTPGSSEGLLGATRLGFHLSPALVKPGLPPALSEEHPGSRGGVCRGPFPATAASPLLTFHFLVLAEAGAECSTVYAQVGPSQQVSPHPPSPPPAWAAQPGGPCVGRGRPGGHLTGMGRKDGGWTPPAFGHEFLLAT